jgi:hypothetical protein
LFDELEELRKRRIENDLQRLSGAAQPAFAENIHQRLDHLFRVAEDDGQDVRLESLKNFVDFLVEHRLRTQPALALTPEGDIAATWRLSRTQIFYVVFLPNEQLARFLIFAPDESRPEIIRKLTGVVPRQALLEMAHTNRVDWVFSDEG